MTATRPTSPARAARRQLLLDRFTEQLTGLGVAHAEHRAKALRDVVDDLGFTLPAALDDPPPPPAGANPDHRKACKAEIDAVLARIRGTRT